MLRLHFDYSRFTRSLSYIFFFCSFFNCVLQSAYATWNPNATTIANQSLLNTYTYAVFVDRNNTIYVPALSANKTFIWSAGSISPTRILSGMSLPNSIFVTSTGDIYVDNGAVNGQVDKFIPTSDTAVFAMHVNISCKSLFVNLNNTIYCTQSSLHQVVKKSLDNNLTTPTIAVGTGVAGATPDMLNAPSGIFVDTNFDIYVVDTGNNRIQSFEAGQINAITVAGSMTINVTFNLSAQMGVALDGNKYVFIVDRGTNRIIGSGPDGFRCIVGCSEVAGSSPSELKYPKTLSFDSYGNLFVADQYNFRIQKFSLSSNVCRKYHV